MAGGGTGGHVMPLLAVAAALKRQCNDCRLVYVGERGGSYDGIVRQSGLFEAVYLIRAGKFRRYHGESWRQRLFDLKTLTLNMVDLWRFVVGLFEAWSLLGRLRPAAVFLKGGYVGVPVGLAAGWLKIPLLTHDSDAVAGLANRLVSRYACWHATAMPADYYPYPAIRVQTVGVPVAPDYRRITPSQVAKAKQSIKVPSDKLMLLVTGGSSGSLAINRAIRLCVDKLLADHPQLWLVHQVGRGKMTVYDGYKHPRIKVCQFLSPMNLYMSAADIVICRGSATTLAELGHLEKAAVVIPSPHLAAGHQLKNADWLHRNRAAIVLPESQLNGPSLPAIIDRLVRSPAERQRLAKRLAAITQPDAADRLARLILSVTGMAG